MSSTMKMNKLQSQRHQLEVKK